MYIAKSENMMGRLPQSLVEKHCTRELHGVDMLGTFVGITFRGTIVKCANIFDQDFSSPDL